VPGGAEEEHERRRANRGRVADAPPRVDEDETDTEEVKREQDDPVDPVGPEPDGLKEHLVDEDRQQRQVAVVGRQQDVPPPRLTVDDELPLVEEESRPEALSVDDDGSNRHEEGERRDGNPRGDDDSSTRRLPDDRRRTGWGWSTGGRHSFIGKDARQCARTIAKYAVRANEQAPRNALGSRWPSVDPTLTVPSTLEPRREPGSLPPTAGLAVVQ
jgi:hypothetical protein